MKLDKLLHVKCTKKSFYRSWVEFFSPYHKLTAREKDVFARILEQYCILRDEVKDQSVLLEVLWSNRSKKDMRESLGVSQAYFQLVMAKLRKNGVLIDDDDIEPRYVPNKTADPRFILYVLFDYSSPDDPIRGEKQD